MAVFNQIFDGVDISGVFYENFSPVELIIDGKKITEIFNTYRIVLAGDELSGEVVPYPADLSINFAISHQKVNIRGNYGFLVIMGDVDFGSAVYSTFFLEKINKAIKLHGVAPDSLEFLQLLNKFFEKVNNKTQEEIRGMSENDPIIRKFLTLHDNSNFEYFTQKCTENLYRILSNTLRSSVVILLTSKKNTISVL